MLMSNNKRLGLNSAFYFANGSIEPKGAEKWFGHGMSLDE